jgi:hypothetical protein
MNEHKRTLVIILSMHRSGSSLTTNVLQAHGMSLGPFELLAGTPSNPHGYFETAPILELSRAVQRLAYGFHEDLPDSPETFSRFLKSKGAWDDAADLPDELVVRGRSLMGSLIESGRISGFKDPRTVLLWPFWQRVLVAFPGVRIVPIVLLRSPHEIAMSLFTRNEGENGYRSCLDVTAVHLARLLEIVESWPETVPRVRFGGPHFARDLALAVEHCGMTWDPVKAGLLFDRSCVHHTSATVTHQAQLHFASLGGGERPAVVPETNQAIVEADAFAREDLYRKRLDRARTELDHVRKHCSDVQTSLAQAEESALRNQDQMRHTQDQLRHTQYQLQYTQDQLQNTQALTRQHVLTQARLQEYQDALRQAQEQLDGALSHGAYLKVRLDRFEIHPVLGPALRGRRSLLRVLRSLRARAAI